MAVSFPPDTGVAQPAGHGITRSDVETTCATEAHGTDQFNAEASLREDWTAAAIMLSSGRGLEVVSIGSFARGRAVAQSEAVSAPEGRVPREDLYRHSPLRRLSPQHFPRGREAQDHHPNSQAWTRSADAS